MSLIFEVRSDSTTSRFSSPGTPKIRSTPSFSSAATRRSDPFFIAHPQGSAPTDGEKARSSKAQFLASAAQDDPRRKPSDIVTLSLFGGGLDLNCWEAKRTLPTLQNAGHIIGRKTIHTGLPVLRPSPLRSNVPSASLILNVTMLSLSSLATNIKRWVGPMAKKRGVFP